MPAKRLKRVLGWTQMKENRSVYEREFDGHRLTAFPAAWGKMRLDDIPSVNSKNNDVLIVCGPHSGGRPQRLAVFRLEGNDMGSTLRIVNSVLDGGGPLALEELGIAMGKLVEL